MIRYFNAYVLYPYLEKKLGRNISPKLKELKEFESLSFEKRDAIRRSEFHRMVDYCKHQVPYYSELFRQSGFNSDKVLTDLRYLEDLPLLTKDIIRERAESLRMSGAHHVRKTGGSTGQSVYFFYDNEGLDWTSAVNLQAYDMAGNFPHKKDSHICSDIGVGPTDIRGHFNDWIKLQSQNRTRLMINSFSDDDLHQSYLALARRMPYLLQGHPSSGYAIADYIRRKGLPLKKYCSVFEPSGEMLTSKAIDTMESYLGCKVVNRYGNAEFGVMAHSQLQGSSDKLAVFERLFYIEPVEQGGIVVSNCTNFGFPLLRYDTGDLGTVRQYCGRSYIYNIQGRIHDVVEINGKSYATHWLMDYLDHKIKGVREFQILLLEDSSFPILQIVAEDVSHEERIGSEVLKKWPKGIEVKFVRYEDLVRVGWQQKFKHVIDMRKSK